MTRDESKMPYSRKRSDGTYEKNAILKRIYKDFGALSPLSMSYKNPMGMTYSKRSFPLPWDQNMKPSSPPRTADSKKFEPYKPRGMPRYSTIDKFIDNLNEACNALPKPLVEDFGRVRPQTVQSQQKREVTYRVKVKESEPLRAQGFIKAAAAEEEQPDERGVSREDSKHLSTMESGVIPPPRLPQINTCMSPEMPLGPWNTPDDGKRDCESRQSVQAPCVCSDTLGAWKNAEDGKSDRERQAAKERSDEEERAFESKKRMEVVKAATMLQSRYRGYKVRRSQPLKYMLMIGSAKNKLQELKQQFNAWKIAVWFPTDHSERLGMTENVLNLLAKLDSIQSVPLYIREFRKSVARDVINFQEEVDAFLRHNSKHGTLFDLVGSDNHSRTRRPKSRTERRTGSASKVKDSVCCNEPPTSWKTVELSSTLQREFAAMEDFTGAPNSDESHSAAIGEIEDCEADDSVRCDQHEPKTNFAMSPEPPEAAAAVEPKENAPLCPQGSLKPGNGADNEISCHETNPPVSVVGPETFDIFIPQRDDCSRNSRKKKYGVRFEDVIDQTEIKSSVQPCSATCTEQVLKSSDEDSSSHNAASEKSNRQYDVAFSNCSDDSERRELTDIHDQRDKIYTSSATAMSVSECPECLTTDAGDGTEGRVEKSEPGCIGTPHEQAPATRCITVHVHNSELLANKSSGCSEEANCLDSNGDDHVQGRLKHQALMADIRNASVNRFGGFGAASPPTKTRFHSEQSLLRTTSADGAKRPGHSHAKYEESCNSSDNVSDSESSDALDEIEEHEGQCQVPSCGEEQNQSGTFAGNDYEDHALGSPRFRRDCGNFQSMRISPRNTFDDRISDAEADIEIESEVESVGVPEVENVSCCSDCARRPGHYAFECWSSTGDEERLRWHPCNESPREVQEEYVPVNCQDRESRDDYCRPTERFDHRELRYFADPYTQKLRRVKQAAQGRTSQNHYTHRPEKSRLLPKPSSAQHVTKRVAHKMTSVTPSPTESICSETDMYRSPSRSPPRSRCQSPYRLTPEIFVSDGRKALQRDEVQIHDRSLLTKLVDDNKRLKALLKDVMNWNKSQSTAMVSMSERIEHLEGLNILA